MKRFFPRLLFLAALLAPVVLVNRPAGAVRQNGTAWVSVRTGNFLVEGGADESELRLRGARLVAHRAASSRMLSGEYFDAGVPTAVVIFPDDSAYAPFKPRIGGRVARNVAGYF